MRPAMYLFMVQEPFMSRGKFGAQSAHAAVEAFRISSPEMIDEWYVGGHYTKLVMAATGAEHLRIIKDYIETRGFKTAMIIDEGRTEVAPHTITALGVEIVDRDKIHVAATFSSFKTFKDPKPTTEPIARRIVGRKIFK